MTTYSTLTGAVKGTEADPYDPQFNFYAMLRISSESDLDLNEISSTLDLEPTSTRQRGQVGSRSVPSREDVWMYRPDLPSSAELSQHIDALWNVLQDHVDFLKDLKARATVSVILGYSSNIDHAGLVVPYRSLELFSALETDFLLNIVVVVEDD